MSKPGADPYPADFSRHRDIVPGVPVSGSRVQLPRYPDGAQPCGAGGGSPHGTPLEYPLEHPPGTESSYGHHQLAQQSRQEDLVYPTHCVYPPPQQSVQPTANHAETPGHPQGAGDYPEPLPCMIGYQLML